MAEFDEWFIWELRVGMEGMGQGSWVGAEN
jgi:hypothetical protein